MGSHISYKQIAKELAKENWGRDDLTKEQLKKNMLQDVRPADACLMVILDVLQNTWSVIERELVRTSVARAREEAHDECLRLLADMEQDHGPCPRDFKIWATSKYIDRSMGALAHNYWKNDSWGNLPEKGTKARAAYDKWIRRKAKKVD